MRRLWDQCRQSGEIRTNTAQTSWSVAESVHLASGSDASESPAALEGGRDKAGERSKPKKWAVVEAPFGASASRELRRRSAN
jgi:hypothetical protein